MGAYRQVGAGTDSAGATSSRARPVESGRGVRRCNVCEREKMGFAIGPTRRGKGTKIIAIAASNSLPLAVAVDSAPPAECQLVEYVLAGSFLGELPERLIGDKAYDSDKLDQRLSEEYGIEMIAPNRSRRSKTQDGRPLRRYRRRWRACLPGCRTTADSSLDGNTTSRTSSASSTSPACKCCSGIYETTCRLLRAIGIRQESPSTLFVLSRIDQTQKCGSLITLIAY